MRHLDEVTEEYLRDHPDEFDAYLLELFEEYAQDQESAILLSSLRILARVKGISEVASESGLSRKGVQKALSEEGHPKFETVAAILAAMGYQLVPKKS